MYIEDSDFGEGGGGGGGGGEDGDMSSIMDESTVGPGPSRCLLILQRSLAIQLTRGPPPQILNSNQHENCNNNKDHPADEMWMYDKGYNLFQVSCC